ncbi:ATP-dependent helicase [Mucilaginibacter robiniae]|uniref:DNA 3'-5' helicase n=1 Tax=Mucilaginibacter robiniae TaxID=2728022 RepID=A0A7L5E0G4_9SPHI|nr:ATP-dependent DNA helicase [Mucilaginibacter robiniae]QJD95857.1 ATP-dependent helicase [Mucilaginibacter robiniae]
MQPSSEKYNQKFDEILSSLNTEQQAAVNKLDGPVLVVAGPGTGKTQILAARIGKILLETDAQPNEILCLTYTDAGAVAMRKRLFEFIGPDAYRINIYTFHAFCNDIIQENLEYFGKLSLEPLTDLESAMLFRELVDEFDKDHLLKRFTGDIYYVVPRLKSLFSTMKRENWELPLIEQAITEYLDDLPNREEFIYKRPNAAKGIKKGDVKQKEIDEAKTIMDKLLCACKEFQNYEVKMKERSRYDYDDMIIWVLRAFREDENLLRRYQERHQYILVDEFQDTSGSQNELLKFLLCYWETPNVFVVGDDDQSIFRFQGANMKNILDFAGDYVSTLYTVVLKQNYRSNQVILDISKALINNNNERLTSQLRLDKNLKAAHPRFDRNMVEPVINEYVNPDQELVDIARQMEQLIARGTEPAEIAVIYRNHNQVEELIHYLDAKQIAVNTKRKIDILALPFGEKIINILRYLAMELDSPFSGDELLFEIMHYDFFDIPPIEIAKASIAVSKANYSIAADETKTSIRRYVSEMQTAAQATLFEEPKNVAMKQLVTDINFLLKASVSLSMQQLFQQVITCLGILKYVMQQPDKGWHMEVLTTLFNFVRDEARKSPEGKLKDIITTVDLMQKNNIRLELTKMIGAENGINFITAHGSKGLEYEHVFLLGCTKKIWDAKGRNTGFSFPDTLMQSAGDETGQQEESRRLFYVALTRAKQCLVISYASHDRNGKDQEASQFVGEILATTHLQVNYPQVTDEAMMGYLATQFSEADKPVVELLDKNYISQLLQNYVLSVTHLNSYLDCPLKFYFQNLIRVPAGKSPAMAFGSAVHHALYKLFDRMSKQDNHFPPLDDFIREFRWFMYRNRDAFSHDEFKLRMDYGDKILPAFYQQNVNHWNKVVRVEMPVRNIVINGVPVKGHLDKVEFYGKQATIVDYKTGKLKYAKEKLMRPTTNQPNGGDYWRQAVFYKMLIDNDRSKDWQVASTVFDFVEPIDGHEYHKEKIVITPDDEALVTTQLTETYHKIMNHEFAIGCGKKDCDWCHFVRSNFKQPGNILESEGVE